MALFIQRIVVGVLTCCAGTQEQEGFPFSGEPFHKDNLPDRIEAVRHAGPRWLRDASYVGSAANANLPQALYVWLWRWLCVCAAWLSVCAATPLTQLLLDQPRGSTANAGSHSHHL